MRGASSDGSAEAVPRGAGVAVLQGMSGLLLQPRPARDRRGWAAEKAVRPGGQAVRARRKGRRPSYALGHTHPVALRGRRARPDVPSAHTRRARVFERVMKLAGPCETFRAGHAPMQPGHHPGGACRRHPALSKGAGLPRCRRMRRISGVKSAKDAENMLDDAENNGHIPRV